LILAGPFLLLTVVPLLAASLFGFDASIIGLIAIANALASSMDLLAIGMILWQVPPKALIRSKNWRTYWSDAALSPDAGRRRRLSLRIAGALSVVVLTGFAFCYVTVPLVDGYQKADIDLVQRDAEFEPGHGYQPAAEFSGRTGAFLYYGAYKGPGLPPDPFELYPMMWREGYRLRMQRAGYTVSLTSRIPDIIGRLYENTEEDNIIEVGRRGFRDSRGVRRPRRWR
jgi:hypothetical protein